MPSFFFQDLGSSLLSLFWILFQADCPFPLHLVVLLGLYLIPLSGTYFSAMSFYLTFCVWGFHSTGFRIVVLLALVFASWWVRLVQGLLQSSWWEGLGPAPWWVELGPAPLLDRAMSRGVSRGLRTTLGSLSVDGWGVVPPCWLFGLRCPNTGACRLLGGARSWCQNGNLQRTHVEEYSLGPLPPVSLPPQWATADPHLPRRPSRTLR